MEQNLQQKTIDFVKGFIKHFTGRGIYALGGMAEYAEAMAKVFSAELLQAFIEEAKKEMVEQKTEQRRDRIAVNERDVEKTQHTALGDVMYKRTYFDTPGGKSYLIGEVLGVLPYERVDSYVSARMVNTSGIMSFGKSASIVTGGKISKQTACQKAMESG